MPAPARLRVESGQAGPDDPIVIVDGVRLKADGPGSPLDRIDPGSIQTIEVIKGAQAVTLYGQDAADGVIVITTKPTATATGRQRRVDIANDTTTINADSVIRTAPITNVTDLLNDRVPGLTVQRTTGAPGDPERLRLRGAASPLQSSDSAVIVSDVRVRAARPANLPNDAIVIVDGVRANVPVDYLNPNIIQSIEVLKGPSAVALYGQDAANGVIVVTTKKVQP
jgi:TonB-dependent SusC/RagA subfamily outer membrane receptor